MEIIYSNHKCLILILSIFYNLYASAQQYVIDHYTYKDGLSSDFIVDMMQDNLGFIWLSTHGGLNRFDGVSFTKYYADMNNPGTPSGDSGGELFEEKNGNIWYVTQSTGLNSYNPKTGKFKRFTNNEYAKENNNNAYTFCEDKSGALYMMSENGLCIYENKTDTIRLLRFKNGNAILPAPAREIFFNAQNRLFLGTTKGVFEVDLKNETITLLEGTDLFSANTLEIQEDSRGHLIIATWGGGLIDYDLQSHTFERYGDYGKNTFWIFSDICIRKENNQEIVWGASYGPNILQVNLSTKTFTEFNVTSYFPEYKENISITNVLLDKHDALWFGSSYGVIKIDPLRQLFQTYPMQHTIKKEWFTTVTAIYHDREDSGNTVWYAVPQAGLFTYNLKTNTSEQIPLPHQIASQFYATEIIRRNANELWIGTNNGLILYNEYTKKTLHFIHDPGNTTSISGNFVSDLQIDKQGRLWVATHFHGINLFIDSCNCFKKIITDTSALQQGITLSESINDLALSPDGTIWAARGFYKQNKTGLTQINTNTLKQTHYFKSKETMPFFPLERDVFTVHIDENKTVWAGYESGVFYFKPAEGESAEKYNTISLINKLNSIFIFSIKEFENYLWLTGNNGINIIDKNTKEVVRNYTTEDGMMSSQPSAITLGENGKIFLGDMNGFQMIDANNIRPNKNIPPVYITSVKILDKEYYENGNTALYTSSLRLRHFQDKITFQFSALNLTNTQNNVYAYMLEGVDKDWIYTSSNTVNYNNLKGGNYTFRVKASNDNGIWNEDGDSMQLTIIPPWYETTWFYIACVLLTALIIYTAYRIRIAQILRIERLRNKISRDLHDDVGSSLSSINMLSKLAKSKLAGDKEKTEELLKKITTTAGYTMENMSDIVWTINPKNDTLADIRIRMQEYLTDTLEAKGIHYTFSVDEEILQTKLSMDIRRDFYLIFKEAVNNLAKYSEATSAEIQISQHANKLIMKVKDNGKGFEINTEHSGNGLLNYKERAKNIHAEFSIESAPGAGTEIKLIVPLR